MKSFDIVIIGGFGHVGLPLGLVFANKGQKVCLFDIDPQKANSISKGKMPFIEYGAGPILKKNLANNNLFISLNPNDISKAKNVIIALGTPIDEYLNPKISTFLNAIEKIKKYFLIQQTIIIRSTVFPSTAGKLMEMLRKYKNREWDIAYCPERIIQGYSVKELGELPQIVAGLTPIAQHKAAKLFSIISPKIIRTNIGEAELIKLFANAWRYIQFAVTNQFYMIATNYNQDYESIRKSLMDGYGRAAAIPSAGFASGPCLLKDTMQLAAFSSNNFALGHAAMMINEGLPNFIVKELQKKHDLSKLKIGILGMAFKADIDDVRDSLSFKIGKILKFHGADVWYSDEYIKRKSFISKERILKTCDIAIIGVPHSPYKDLKPNKNIEMFDIWGIFNKKGK